VHAANSSENSPEVTLASVLHHSKQLGVAGLVCGTLTLATVTEERDADEDRGHRGDPLPRSGFRRGSSRT
jgi:hypothetical protein